MYEPPNPQILAAARQRRLNELKMYDILREVGLYIIYVGVVMIISYDLHDPNGFYVTQSMSTFLDGGLGSAATSNTSLLQVS
jgi:hypothetical protein